MEWPVQMGLAVFALGALWGSFANVVIHRLPLGESVVRPRSQCPKCRNQISWFDNIPIISWFILKGKCRRCGAAISLRYPLVELMSALGFTLIYVHYGFSWITIEYIVFFFGLLVGSWIDIDHMILPDQITLGGLVVGLLGAMLNPERSFWDALLGVLLGGGFLWLIAILYYSLTKNEGMGGGDIKLLAWIGALLGWKAIPFVILVSALVGTMVGLGIALRSSSGLKTAIPFGPYLALGALIYMLGGQTLAQGYLGFFLPAFVE